MGTRQAGAGVGPFASSGFANANQEIRAAWRSHAQAEVMRRREQEHVRRIDELLTALEELHLKGCRRAPYSLGDALSAVREVLPEGRPDRLRPGGDIAGLIDELFDLQEPLLRRASRRHPGVSPGASQDWSRAS